MKEGAQDYLIKGQIENRALPRALRHAVERNRMQTETEMIRTQQMQFKDEFLSHVSHELRSPLTAIYQFVTILLDKLAGELNPEQNGYLEIVLRNVKQLRSMINDLLEVTRLQAGKLVIELQQASISDAVKYAIDTLEMTATAKNVGISSDVESSLPSICADPTRLRQILIILVDNAIKFTPENGSVKIRARIFENEPNRVILEVRDTGCGIRSGMTERIFERLVQASDPALEGRKGLGLGLHICKELVSRQGGKISAENLPERGALFSVVFPVFSLPDLIAPGLRSRGGAEGPITLVVTEISSRTGWLSDKARAQHSQEVRDLLQRCLRSDLDVLLPMAEATTTSEIFFLVAFTNEIGGEAIQKRIRQQWEACPDIQQADLTLTTSYKSFGLVDRINAESMDNSVESIAAQLQQLMDDEISTRKVINGQ
jgi:nitrogen-specific signal transduction histidine kinase